MAYSDLSPTSFSWQITLTGVAASLDPPAYNAATTPSVGSVYKLSGGGYAACTANPQGAAAGIFAQPRSYQTGVTTSSAGVVFTVTSPLGFSNGFVVMNKTGADVYTSGSAAVSATNGNWIPANQGQPVPEALPTNKYVIGTGVVTVEGFV